MNTYCNPIKKQGDFADPFVLRHNGKYYLYGTNPDVRCWSSEDLVNWTLEGPTVTEDEFPGLVPFAPEVVYSNGSFYMYTSPHGFGHYVLKSDSPTGPFRKITGNVGHSIDFSVFIDDDGQWYTYWADERGLVGCRMASPTEFGEEVLIGAYMHGWTEGPFVVKRDGKYHLSYTGNHFLSKGYRINAAIADHPLGPYRDDAYNPVIVCTEGAAVGLGHSSTVLGPDLHTYYIVYHNLNPDKSRDLNIDPVVFTPQRAYVLGPSSWERPAPSLPKWKCRRFESETVACSFTEEVELPASGAAELNLAACGGTARYGIMFNKAQKLRLEFNRGENTLSLRDGRGLIAEAKLLSGHKHEALHCIRLEYGQDLTVYIDNLLLLKAAVTLGGGEISYYAEGELALGTLTVHPSGDQLHYPVPGLMPADRECCFDLLSPGEYQFTALGCRESFGAVLVDGKPLLPVLSDGENSLAIYRCPLERGSHSLSCPDLFAQSFAVTPFYPDGSETVNVQNFGPYDKIRGAEKRSDLRLRADFSVAECGEGWQAGVLFRADHLSDGGEGDDKLLGSNFFVGYRLCITESSLQLWKHRYDSRLLKELPYEGGRQASFELIAEGNAISLWMNNKLIMEYREAEPILWGYSGFHARNCIITRGSIN